MKEILKEIRPAIIVSGLIATSTGIYSLLLPSEFPLALKLGVLVFGVILLIVGRKLRKRR